jgi:hypothetical protein
MAIYSAWKDDPNSYYTLTGRDWLNLVTQNISSMRNIDRERYALEFGKWLDRHHGNIDDIGVIDSVFRTLTGATDQKIDDNYLLKKSLQERQDMYASAAKQYYEFRARADEAAANKDYDNADIYNKNAIFAIQGLPDEEVAKVFAGDATRNKNQIDKTLESFWLKRVPKDKQEVYTNTFKKYYQQRQ